MQLASQPRPAGGEAEARAREACRGHLTSLGFQVHDVPFAYATWPGRWGTPVVGVMWIVAALIAYRYPPAIFIAGFVLAAAVRWMQKKVIPGQTRGTNLEARRGDPAIWLVAHLDSKSQPIPILVRAAAIVVCVILWVTLAAMAVLHVPVHAVAIAAALAGLPVAISTVGARSPGALDNATG